MLMIDNEASVKTIEGSLFLLALDPAPETELDEEADAGRAAAHAMHATGIARCAGNRWFDKTIQVRERVFRVLRQG